MANTAPGPLLTDADVDRILQEAESRLSAREQGKDATALTAPSAAETSPSAALPAAAAAAPAADGPNVQSDGLSVRAVKARLPKKEYEQQTKATAGAAWFNLPRTELTPELARDLKLLKMRNVLDSKRFYKKDNSKASVPEFSQIGTVVAGPTEYFTARVTKKDRKRTLLEEVMQAEAENRKFKSKYGEIQTAKTSGKKGHYKKMMQKRYGKK